MASTTFTGDQDELKALVEPCGIKGAWEVEDNSHHQYRTRDGAQLNLWATSGTVSYTGKAEATAPVRRSPVLVSQAMKHVGD